MVVRDLFYEMDEARLIAREYPMPGRSPQKGVGGTWTYGKRPLSCG